MVGNHLACSSGLSIACTIKEEIQIVHPTISKIHIHKLCEAVVRSLIVLITGGRKQHEVITVPI
jgi:hypothetical protein